jgi:hypothetical protein
MAPPLVVAFEVSSEADIEGEREKQRKMLRQEQEEVMIEVPDATGKRCEANRKENKIAGRYQRGKLKRFAIIGRSGSTWRATTI